MTELVQVIKGKAKLSGKETETEICAMLAAHLALRDNGLLATSVEYNRQGQPAYIVSYWKISPLENHKQELPPGQSLITLPKQVFDALS